jgi:hypothetical protein
MSTLKFKPLGDKSIRLRGRYVFDLKRQSNTLSRGSKTLYVLDGNVDGFRAAYFKGDDFVGLTVVPPPAPEEEEEATARFLSAIKRIIHLSIGQLEYAETPKVLLQLVNEWDYFDMKRPDFSNILAGMLKDESHVEGKPDLNYTGTKLGGMYVFEVPNPWSLSEHDFACGKFVKVDMDHPDMKTDEARAFFKRLGSDLTLCRGKTYLEADLSRSYYTGVLYLMFRNKVSADEEWWKDLNNVALVCAAIQANIFKKNGTMYLGSICSRPGTTGAVAQMLKNISIDAKHTYSLDRLVLTPAGSDLGLVYGRPAYGFEYYGEGQSMVKYLTESGRPEAGETGATESFLPWR